MGNRKTLLWLDDVRDPFVRELYDDPVAPQEIDWLNFSPIGKDVDVTWVKTYQEFVDNIMIYGLPDAICFDHDLGIPLQLKYREQGKSKRESRRLTREIERTGYDCAVWLVEYCKKNNKQLPAWNIQSANPVGKENIKKLLENYGKRTGK